jgi:hypothetical protein
MNLNKYRFSALLECKNHLCREVVAIAGHGYGYYEQMVYYDEDSGDPESDMIYIEKFYPDYMNPSPMLIVIPAKCPDDLREELHKAFIASWGDTYAALNHIRSSIEKLLNNLEIGKIKIDNEGKQSRLRLHDRIVSLGNHNKHISDSLLAVKWLGNAGSHADKISLDDIYDALDIVEMVLDDL